MAETQGGTIIVAKLIETFLVLTATGIINSAENDRIIAGVGRCFGMHHTHTHVYTILITFEYKLSHLKGSQNLIIIYMYILLLLIGNFSLFNSQLDIMYSTVYL